MERKVIQEHINMYDKWGERCMINGEYLYKMKDETFLNFINMYENLDQTSNIYNDDINYTHYIIFSKLMEKRNIKKLLLRKKKIKKILNGSKR